jgi:hypothetical protein
VNPQEREREKERKRERERERSVWDEGTCLIVIEHRLRDVSAGDSNRRGRKRERLRRRGGREFERESKSGYSTGILYVSIEIYLRRDIDADVERCRSGRIDIHRVGPDGI